MKKGIKIILLVVMTLALTTVLFGCGGGKETESSTVVVGIGDDLDSLDLHNAEKAGTREVLFNIYEGLVKCTPSGDLEPAVARDYDISEDAKVYTFILRDGITFHDGSLVTVEDIKYSIERYAGIVLSDPNAVSAFSIIEEVAIVDENTVEIRLSEGNSEFLGALTCGIMPQSNEENQDTNPIGTGPFKYVSYTPGESLVVEKYEGYWKEGFPKVDNVEFKVVMDPEVAMLELQAGTLDIYQYLSLDQADALSENFNIAEGGVNYVQSLFLNNEFEPFSNTLVRQAMAYAIDRDYINKQIYDGKAAVLGTHMVDTYSKYYNSETETVYTKNIEKAKELLTQAGYEDGFEFTIVVPSNFEPHRLVAEIIVEQLKEIGITANIEMVDFGTTWLTEVYGNRNYEASVCATDSRIFAPSGWFEKNISTGTNNFTNYSNEEFDRLYEEAYATTDEEEKIELYGQMQMILAEDAASIYIQNPANLVAVNNRLAGYEFYPIAAQDLSVIYFVD